MKINKKINMFKVYCASAIFLFKVEFKKCLGLGLYVLKHHQFISTEENVRIIIILYGFRILYFSGTVPPTCLLVNSVTSAVLSGFDL